MRHVLGEALSVGAVLNWGPSYYHQRQYFEAKDNKVSTASTLLRYDLEVSGFPSSHCGHLVLLRLREQDYPGHAADRGLALVGSADPQVGEGAGRDHRLRALRSGAAGERSRELPNYEMPMFNGIGANEYIVDVTHDVGRFHLGRRHAVPRTS